MNKLAKYLKFNFKDPLFRVLPYILPYWKTYSCLILLLFVNLSITVLMAWLLQTITDSALNKDFYMLKNRILLGILMLAVISVLSYINTYLESVSIHKVTQDLKLDLFNKTLRMRMDHFSNYHSGELLSRLTNDINNATGLVGSNLLNLIRLPLTSLAVFIYLSSLNWKLSLFSVSISPLLLLFGVIFGSFLKSNSKKMLENSAKINSFLNDVFAGYTIVRTFSLERLFYGKYQEFCRKQFDLEVNYAKLSGGMSAGTSVISGIVFFANLGFGSYLVAHDALTVGSLLAFISLIQHLVYPFMNLASCWSGFQHSVSAFERVCELLGSQSEYKTLSIPARSTQSNIEIELQNISFSYDLHIHILKNLSITIPAGKVTAIVGPSGAGKSTLFKLLLGLYRPCSGSIVFNGKSVREMHDSELRNCIAYVPQESYLFDGTIRENLLYGDPDASELDLVRAAKSAQIHEFIMSLPNQYDSQIGERGVQLSGGQKQRIAIARALLKNSPILLLDEATSALDNENEYIVQQALRNLMAGRTTLVIAHRISTIQDADWILVMDKGRIISQGTHQILLNQDHVYTKMHQLQFRNSDAFLGNSIG